MTTNTNHTNDLPDTKTVGGQTLHLLRNNLGPICNEFGEPLYATLPGDSPTADSAPQANDLPDTKTVGGQTLHLLRNNLGPICNEFGEPLYATLPTD